MSWERVSRPAAYALCVWLALTLSLVALDYLRTQATPSAVVVIQRMGELFVPSLPFFFGPLLLLVILFGVARKMWHAAIRFGVLFGAWFFGLFGGFCLGLALLTFFDGDDPWEAMPWITPPYLDAFLRQHPNLRAITYDGTRQVTLHDRKGHYAIVDGNDLVDAKVTFEACPEKLEPALFGGMPPFPSAVCSARYRISNPKRAWTTYIFDAPSASLDGIETHFRNWAQSIGAEERFTGSRDYYFHAQKGAREWDLRVRYGRNLNTQIFIPENGATPKPPEKPEADEHAPNDEPARSKP